MMSLPIRSGCWRIFAADLIRPERTPFHIPHSFSTRMANQSKKPTAQPRSTKRVQSERARAERPPIVIAGYWAIGIFVLVTLIFFWGHITGKAFLWEDFTEFTYPNEVFAARSFAAGILPHWNPYTFNGMPFLADLQIGFFYPGNLLMYMLSGGSLGVGLGQMFVIVHYLIAMIGMWKLARWFGIGSIGAIFAGISYALSGMMVVHMIHPNMIHHLAWFPLITYLFHRGLTERSWLHSLLAGITLGVALLSGHPQSALYMVLFLFALTVFTLVRHVRAGRTVGETAAKRSPIMMLLVAALPVIIGVGIFAVQLLPSQELAGLSERAEMTYEKSLEGAVGPGQLLTLVVPKFFGVAGPEAQASVPFWYRPEPYYFWETAIYIGVVTLILAGIGLVAGRIGPLRWFLAVMGLLGLLYALGDSFFVHPLLGRLPLLSTFRIPTRMAIYLAFGGAILAGAGLDRLMRGGDNEARARMAALVVGGVVVLVGLLTVSGALASAFNAPEQLAAAIRSSGIVALLVGGATLAVSLLALKERLAPLPAGAILLVLGVVDLFAFGYGQNNAKDNPQTIYSGNDQQFAAYKAEAPAKLYRVKMRDDRGMLMQRNQGQFSGIMLYEGYNPLLLKRRVPPGPTIDKRLDLLNIAYEVKVDSLSGSAALVERPSRYPHARMLYDVRRVANDQEAESVMTSGQVDFGKTVVLQDDPGIALNGAGTGQASVTRYDADAIDVAVTTDKPGVLLLSEIWYPAWEVSIDGTPAALLRADFSLRGVAVPAGKHTVSMRFHSSAFATGLWVTIATTVASLVGVVLLAIRARARRSAGA